MAAAPAPVQQPTQPVQNGSPPVQAPPSQPTTPWYSTIEDAELRGYTETKGWQSPIEAVKSYRELEKLRGVPADQLLQLPGKDAKPEDYLPIYDRLGRPAKVEDYKLAGPDGSLTDPFATHIGPVMHNLGITATQAKGLNEAYNAFSAQLEAANEAEMQRMIAADDVKLQQAWPTEQIWNENMALAKKAAFVDYNVTPEELDQMQSVIGKARVLQLFAKIGGSTGEAKYVEGTGGPRTFGMTPDGARAEIAALKTDKDFTRRVNDGEAAALAKLDQLQRIAVSDRSQERR